MAEFPARPRGYHITTWSGSETEFVPRLSPGRQVFAKNRTRGLQQTERCEIPMGLSVLVLCAIETLDCPNRDHGFYGAREAVTPNEHETGGHQGHPHNSGYDGIPQKS